MPIDTAHPIFIGLNVVGIVVIHAREEHVLRIFVAVFVAHDKVRILFIGAGLFFPSIDGRALIHIGKAAVAIHF